MRAKRLRILVAEDSPTARQLLVEILKADAELEVVGEAKDGVEAVALTHRLRPDLVTMDIHMPRMDGLEATRRIMAEVPTPVVVVSTLVERDILTSMAALRTGALAVMQKLVGPTAPDFDKESRRLCDTLKALAEVRVVHHAPTREPKPEKLGGVVAPRWGRTAGVALAASTGGPAALHGILSKLPESYPLPLLVVQHIALGFAEGLARWLDEACALRVKVAEAGEPLEGGVVYMAPEDRHLCVGEGQRVQLSHAAPVGGFRPSGTPLFRSAAKEWGQAAAACILTGMGEDGLDGLRDVHEARGWVMAQDEVTSVVYGMPAVAVAAGLADEVLALEDFPTRLRELAGLEARAET